MAISHSTSMLLWSGELILWLVKYLRLFLLIIESILKIYTLLVTYCLYGLKLYMKNYTFMSLLCLLKIFSLFICNFQMLINLCLFSLNLNLPLNYLFIIPYPIPNLILRQQSQIVNIHSS